MWAKITLIDGRIQFVDDLVEVHYNYNSFEKRVAFESNDTGFTLSTKDIKEFEVFNTPKGITITK